MPRTQGKVVYSEGVRESGDPRTRGGGKDDGGSASVVMRGSRKAPPGTGTWAGS